MYYGVNCPLTTVDRALLCHRVMKIPVIICDDETWKIN